MTTQKTAAILFADIAGSSRLYKDLGDTRAQEIIGSALSELTAITHQHQGEVIKTIGDEIMACFDTAEAAIDAAIAMQHVRSNSTPRTDARIGVHYGPTLVQDDDVFGEAVNDAAHLVAVARAGQIITSDDTVRELPDRLKPLAHRFDQIRLKGSNETSVIHRVGWEEDDQESTGSFSTQLMSAVVVDEDETELETPRLELHYADRRISVSPEQVPFVVGRDPEGADLPVPSKVASRDHFHIEYRRGKFVLADNSTNGTWVQLEGQAPIYLRREELPLTAPGTIGVGRAIQEDDPHLIRFTL